MSPNNLKKIKVLAFDVFGTVVDWHGSVARAVDLLDLGVSGDEFALAWRAGYQPTMQRVRSGELGWTILNDLHRLILDDILEQFGVDSLSEEQKSNLNSIWQRLDAWSDSVEGLTRLKSRYMICSLSNANIGMLAKMAKNAGLPWDCILSAEVFKKYKPDPAVYLGTARVFDLAPQEVMLVAAHQNDLAAARACGLATAYIERPMEYGNPALKELSPHPDNTLHATSIAHLATLLGC